MRETLLYILLLSTNRLWNCLPIIASLSVLTNTLFRECEDSCLSHIFYFSNYIYLIKNKKWEHWEFQYHRNSTTCCSSWRYMQAPAGKPASSQPRNAIVCMIFLGANDTWSLLRDCWSRSKWYFEPRSAGICRREPRLSAEPYLQRPSTGHRSSYSSPGHGRLRDPQNTCW